MMIKRIAALSLTLLFISMTNTCIAERFDDLVDYFLGDSNGFTLFDEARSDQTYNYEKVITDMVYVLANGFNTGKLGTPMVEAAVTSLIPEKIYIEKKNPDSMMEAMYTYFTKKNIPRYFTINFDSAGNPISVDITLDNVKTFVNDGIKNKVFTGTFDEFDLNPKISTLDEFCNTMNITKEVAVAFCYVLESYDISWLDEDYSTLLDEFSY